MVVLNGALHIQDVRGGPMNPLIECATWQDRQAVIDQVDGSFGAVVSVGKVQYMKI